MQLKVHVRLATHPHSGESCELSVRLLLRQLLQQRGGSASEPWERLAGASGIKIKLPAAAGPSLKYSTNGIGRVDINRREAWLKHQLPLSSAV